MSSTIDCHGPEYTLRCLKGHVQELTPSDFQTLLEGDVLTCSECSETVELEDDRDLSLQCYICNMEFYFSTLEEARSLLHDECAHCAEYDFGSNSINVPRSIDEAFREYEWARTQKSAPKLLRPKRTDYWEGLVHWCNEDEFASIMQEQVVRAAPTGYFKLPAVCLSEIPQGNWEEIREVHGRYGLVFSKRDILAATGGPAVYLTDALISKQNILGFCDALRPFVTLLRTPTTEPSKKRHDYLHEREWRVPRDLLLSETKPYAVVIDEIRLSSPHARLLLDAVANYRELSPNLDTSDEDPPTDEAEGLTEASDDF